MRKTVETFKIRLHLRWFGPMMRMGDEPQPNRVWQARSLGKWIRERPIKTWHQIVGECLKKKEMEWGNAKKIARKQEYYSGSAVGF